MEWFKYIRLKTDPLTALGNKMYLDQTLKIIPLWETFQAINENQSTLTPTEVQKLRSELPEAFYIHEGRGNLQTYAT